MGDTINMGKIERRAFKKQIAELEAKLEKLTRASREVVDSYVEDTQTGSVTKLIALSAVIASLSACAAAPVEKQTYLNGSPVSVEAQGGGGIVVTHIECPKFVENTTGSKRCTHIQLPQRSTQ